MSSEQVDTNNGVAETTNNQEALLKNGKEPNETTRNDKINEVNEFKNEDISNMSMEDIITISKKRIDDEDLEGAIAMLCTCLEQMTADEQQNANAQDIAHVYMLYGEALLRLSQKSDDLFGDGVPRQVPIVEGDEDDEHDLDDADDDADDDQDDDANAEDQQGDDNEDITIAQSRDEPLLDESKLSEMAEQMAEVIGQAQDVARALRENENGAQEMLEQMGDDDDSADDRMLAWESLETARGLLEEMTDNKSKQLLADCHALLAELQMEDEQFDGAIKDFKEAKRILVEINAKPREIAYIHFMTALVGTYASDNDLCIEEYESALRILMAHIYEILPNSFKPNGKQEQLSVSEGYKAAIVAIDSFCKDKASEQTVIDRVNEVRTFLEDIFAKLEECYEISQGQNEAVTDTASAAATNSNSNSRKRKNVNVPNINAAINAINESGVTTIGFGDSSNIENTDTTNTTVKHLGSFGSTANGTCDVSAPAISTSGGGRKKSQPKKRSLDVAEITCSAEAKELEPQTKKMKISSPSKTTTQQ